MWCARMVLGNRSSKWGGERLVVSCVSVANFESKERLPFGDGDDDDDVTTLRGWVKTIEKL